MIVGIDDRHVGLIAGLDVESTGAGLIEAIDGARIDAVCINGGYSPCRDAASGSTKF